MKNEDFKIKENQLNYVVYLTINQITNQQYVGVFSFVPGTNKGDYTYTNYIGQGITHNKQAEKMKKTEFVTNVTNYGFDNFNRINLLITTDEAEAYNKEIELLNDSFLSNPSTLNQRKGGKNGKWGSQAKHRKSIGCLLGKNPNAKKVKCTKTGKVFTSIKEASMKLKINYKTLCGHLRKGISENLILL